MMATMPVQHTLRAHVVTPVDTYKAHQIDIDEQTRIALVIDRMTQEPVLTMHDVEVTILNREAWRVEGVLKSGERQVWKASRACSCSAPAVYPTLAYDIPT